MVGESHSHFGAMQQQAFAAAMPIARYHAEKAHCDPYDLLHDAWKFVVDNASALARDGRDASFNAVVEFYGRRAVQLVQRREKLDQKYAIVTRLADAKAENPTSSLERQEIVDTVMAEVDRLCPTLREEVSGLLSGLSVQEIAVSLQQPVKVIESRVSRAKRLLSTSPRLRRIFHMLLSLPPFALLLSPRRAIAQKRRLAGLAAACAVALVVTLGMQLDLSSQESDSPHIEPQSDQPADSADSAGERAESDDKIEFGRQDEWSQTLEDYVVGKRDDSIIPDQSAADVPNRSTSEDVSQSARVAASDEKPNESEGFLQEHVEYFQDTGGVYQRWTTLNGEVHGKVYMYRKNGTLWKITRKVHGVRHGVTEDHDSTGTKVWRRITYENGKAVKWEKLAEDDN